jgi:hypothetical protein
MEELPSLTNVFTTRFPGADIISVTSNAIGIGCHCIHKGITVFPFESCKTIADISRTITTLEQNPFLFRLLSIEVVTTLRFRMADAKLHVDTWDQVFPDSSSITHQVCVCVCVFERECVCVGVCV